MPLFPFPSNSGVVKVVTGANPAANSEVSDTVPIAANEVQTITGTPSGTFGLSFGGLSGPATLSTTESAANIQAYLRANFSNVGNGSDGATVTGGPLPSAVTVTFDGASTSFRNVAPLAVTGATTGLTFATTTQGGLGKSWYLMAVSVSLVQGLTQTPNPQLIIDDGTNILYQSVPFASAQNVSTTTVYTWAPGLSLSGGGAATTATNSIPAHLVLPGGFRIRTVTAGKGANTDYGTPFYWVCELG